MVNGDYFGSGVGIDGDIIAVGSGMRGSTGALFIFESLKETKVWSYAV